MKSKTSEAIAEHSKSNSSEAGQRNVLFIVYYFPPMGSSGVQRPLKFVKYLREFGWNPIIIAPEPGAYHTFDKSLQQELDQMNIKIHRVGAKTPFHLLGKNARQINYIPDRVAGLIRKFLSFFYLPDNKTGWIKPAIRKAEQVMADNEIDVIFSTAPPYSNHLITAELKKTTGKPVVMDFRDDWLECPFINYPTKFHKAKMAKMERECVGTADAVIANNTATMRSIESRCASANTGFHLLKHGFDPEDFASTHTGIKKKKLSLLYSGIFYGEQAPDFFLKAVSELLEEEHITRNEIEIIFQGGLDNRVRNHIRSLKLTSISTDYGFLPHKQAIKNLKSADVLWMVVGYTKNANLTTPGKLFEYMATRKPILGLVPEGGSKEDLLAYKASYICDPYNLDDIKITLLEVVEAWRNKTFPAPDEKFIEKHDRRQITGELAGIMNQLIKKQ